MILQGLKPRIYNDLNKVRQAMDEGTPLGGLESEDNAKPSHGLHAVLSSLWGQGYLAHRLRIRFPEDEGVRRPEQPDQPRRLIGPTGGGSGHGLTTLGRVSAVPATLQPEGFGPETSRWVTWYFGYDKTPEGATSSHLPRKGRSSSPRF
jgi:hypothetical protein